MRGNCLAARRFAKQIQNGHKIKSIAKYRHNVIEVRGGRIRCRRHYDDGFSPLFSPLRARFSDLFKLRTRYVLRNDRDLVILIRCSLNRIRRCKLSAFQWPSLALCRPLIKFNFQYVVLIC